MKQTITNDLEKFISIHMRYQLTAFALSNRADNLGFSGFGHFYQVEAADAFVHTRRIMNYILMSNSKYKTAVPNFDPSKFDNLDIIELMGELIKIKEEILMLTNQLSENARQNIDYATARFYEWYLIDLTEEIDEDNDWYDYMKFDKTQIVTLERKFSKTSEPDVDVVQKPFTINAQ